MSEVTLEDIVSLAKRRGFIYQGSEVYGGLAGTWDYGPLGVALKRNIMQLWWKMFVEDAENMYGVDAAILMNKKVWEASGHVDTFTDPMIECPHCHTRFRADKFVPGLPESDTDFLWSEKWRDARRGVHGYTDKDMPRKAANATMLSFHEKKIVCPACMKTADFTEPRQFNMMFKTDVGPNWVSVEHENTRSLRGEIEFLDDEGNPAPRLSIEERSDVNSVELYDRNAKSYLRPETAQGIFTNFKNVVDSLYPDIPFGIAQQGKAFRNEISPRDFVFRSREFEQMEIEYFVHPEHWEEAFEDWRKRVHEWFKAIGLPEAMVHELEVPEEDRAHYSKRTIYFEFDFPHGRDELLGMAYRTDFDLQNIQRASGKSMEYRPKDGSAPFVPHVIEPSFGVERAIMAVLTAAYTVDEIGGEKRTVLKLPAHLAPVKVAVSPLLKNKPELVAKAREVYAMLKKEFGAVMWDDNGNIGKRYRRQDEIGTPYCVTIDFQTLENNTVTVRNRDTTEQNRVGMPSLASELALG